MSARPKKRTARRREPQLTPATYPRRNARPRKKNARPDESERASFGKHPDNSTPDAGPQDSALAELCKAFMRAGPAARRLFLCDVRTAEPILWRDIEREHAAAVLAQKRHAPRP